LDHYSVYRWALESGVQAVEKKVKNMKAPVLYGPRDVRFEERTQPQVFILYVKPQSAEAFAATQIRIRGQAFRGTDPGAAGQPEQRKT
jgi:hypothetical protein